MLKKQLLASLAYMNIKYFSQVLLPEPEEVMPGYFYMDKL